MFIVFMKDNSSVYYSGFVTWKDARAYGQMMFGPGGYEIEME